MAPFLPKESAAKKAHEPARHARLVPLPEGPACVMAIGTAFPAATIDQSKYHDKLFAMCSVTDNDSLKTTFKRLCESSRIDKRHTFVSPELVLQHPELATYSDASLATRLAIADKVLPEIAVEAARNAVGEWGRPLSAITHMVLATTSATGNIPGIDLAIAQALDLGPTVQRTCIYQTGFSGGGAALRVGRLLAESARDARVLVIAAEATTAMTFRKPIDKLDGLLVHATLGDGAAALVVGCDPVGPSLERPLFEIHWSAQMSVPNSESSLGASMSESGVIWRADMGAMCDGVIKHLQALESEGRALVGAASHSDLFWVVHPGARMILDTVQAALALDPEQLRPSWDVLRCFGNCSSPTVLMVMDEMRRWSARLGAATTGAGREWGFLVSFGPGFTMEASLLRSVPL